MSRETNGCTDDSRSVAQQDQTGSPPGTSAEQSGMPAAVAGLETPGRTLDYRGLFCPEPVMLLHAAVRNSPVGACLTIRATDPATLRDIPRFCKFLGHTLLDQHEQAGEFRFRIRLG